MSYHAIDLAQQRGGQSAIPATLSTVPNWGFSLRRWW